MCLQNCGVYVLLILCKTIYSTRRSLFCVSPVPTIKELPSCLACFIKIRRLFFKKQPAHYELLFVTRQLGILKCCHNLNSNAKVRIYLIHNPVNTNCLWKTSDEIVHRSITSSWFSPM